MIVKDILHTGRAVAALIPMAKHLKPGPQGRWTPPVCGFKKMRVP